MELPEDVVPVPEGMIRRVILAVTCVGGCHMPKMDTLLSKCDSFCVLEWAGQTHETEAAVQSFTPAWNAVLAFRAVVVKAGNAPVGDFTLSLFHFDSPTERQLIGIAIVPAEHMAKVRRPPKLSPTPANVWVPT